MVAKPINFTLKEPVHLYKGKAPGSEQWIYPEAPVGFEEGTIYNVSDPTYVAYIPDSDQATGTSVLIAPGGGFRILALEHEGHAVARWLAARGIAAFVLKYRLVQLKQMNSWLDMSQSMNDIPPETASSYGIADGKEALKQIRTREDEYGIKPDKIVALGFSAGAHIVSYLGINPDLTNRPNFVAMLYGAPFGGVPNFAGAKEVNALAPFFFALAQDDTLAGKDTRDFYKALIGKGYAPELHCYTKGGHGFGMRSQGTSSDYWIDDFHHWLEAQSLTQHPIVS